MSGGTRYSESRTPHNEEERGPTAQTLVNSLGTVQSWDSLEPEQSLDSGLGTLALGQGSWDSGLGTVVLGQWSWDSGLGTEVLGQLSWDSGLGTVVLGQWSWDSGLGTVVLGQRS